jgi:hypothetical protein
MRLLSLAAILGCLAALPAPAMALDVGLSLGASTAAKSGDRSLSLDLGADLALRGSAGLGPTLESTTSASLSANASSTASLTLGDDLAQVAALIEASDWTETSLAGITSVEATAYDVSAWIDAESAADFALVLEDNADEIGTLQTALAANLAFETWLDANGESADDVIAIGVAADGSLAVFTN